MISRFLLYVYMLLGKKPPQLQQLLTAVKSNKYQTDDYSDIITVWINLFSKSTKGQMNRGLLFSKWGTRSTRSTSKTMWIYHRVVIFACFLMECNVLMRWNTHNTWWVFLVFVQAFLGIQKVGISNAATYPRLLY